MTNNNDRKTTLKEAFDAELLKHLEENPPEIPSYEQFSAMIDANIKKTKFNKKRIIGLAASIVIALLIGTLAFVQLTPDVDADKNPKEEIVTEDGVIIEDGGWGSSVGEINVWETKKREQVAEAEKIYENLLVPKYIPREYVFKSLIVKTIAEEDIVFEYVFANKHNERIEIEGFATKNIEVSTNVSEISHKENCEKGTVYFSEKNKMATIQIDSGTIINIWTEVSNKKIIKIINNLSD